MFWFYVWFLNRKTANRLQHSTNGNIPSDLSDLSDFEDIFEPIRRPLPQAVVGLSGDEEEHLSDAEVNENDDALEAGLPGLFCDEGGTDSEDENYIPEEGEDSDVEWEIEDFEEHSFNLTEKPLIDFAPPFDYSQNPPVPDVLNDPAWNQWKYCKAPKAKCNDKCTERAKGIQISTNSQKRKYVFLNY